MALRSMRDIALAFAEGRTHLQFGYKNSGVTGDNFFQDWAYVGGLPGINPRIGTALTWTPQVAEKNQAIYFPPAGPGEDIIITEWGMRTNSSSTNQTATYCMLFDLLGYYPLIDGDSTDEQELTGSGLPRYADGVGVQMALVNHLVPQAAAAVTKLTYTDCENTEQTVQFSTQNNGQNKVCSAPLTSAGGISSGISLTIPTAGACRGVKAANRIQFATAPSGLFCLYFFRPLAYLPTISPGIIDNPRPWAITDFGFKNGLNFPRIYNGAHLSFFHQPISAGRSSSCAYYLNFARG